MGYIAPTGALLDNLAHHFLLLYANGTECAPKMNTAYMFVCVHSCVSYIASVCVCVVFVCMHAHVCVRACVHPCACV